MAAPFILITLAMAITISLQWRRIKRQEKLISDFNEKGFREVIGFGKVYRCRYIFVNIENAGDNGTLNRLATTTTTASTSTVRRAPTACWCS